MALLYKRAVSMHKATCEKVFVVEQVVMADENRLDPTWQETLNHATCKRWTSNSRVSLYSQKEKEDLWHRRD
ncbi:unnamed protein product [Caretta caretta]